MDERAHIAAMALTVVNVPVYLFLGRALFGCWQGFLDAILFWFKPRFWSYLQGNWTEHVWAELKLALFFLLCIGLIGLQLFLLSPLLAR